MQVRAAILAVGSELLGTTRLDTNSLRITSVLDRGGARLVRKGVVADDEEEIAGLVREWLDEVELLVLCGGLGPTADDRTRTAVARALGRELELDEDVLEEIRRRFREVGREMPDVNRRQAERIEGALLLENHRGTAPGQRVDTDGATIFLLPGVPSELEPMLEEHLVPWLARHGWSVRTAERRLRVACLAESEVEELLAPLYERHGVDGAGLLAAPGEVTVVLRASGPEGELERQLDAMTELARELLGPALTGDRDEPLEQVVGRLLAARGATVAVGESCTGGLVGERLTQVAGSSQWFLGGVIAYANAVKTDLLDVEPGILRADGAVSRSVAEAMAVGAREVVGADWGIGITGIAGPGGGSREKPVGLVFVAVDGPGDGPAVTELRLPGDRRTVRRLASQWGLDLLRRRLAGLPVRESLSRSPEYSG